MYLCVQFKLIACKNASHDFFVCGLALWPRRVRLCTAQTSVRSTMSSAQSTHLDVTTINVTRLYVHGRVSYVGVE